MKKVLLFITLVMVAAAAVGVFRHDEGIREAARAPESSMHDIVLVNRVSGAERWTLRAERIYLPGEGVAARLSAVSIDIPEHGMSVVSRAGSYDLGTRDLTLSGHIVATAGNLVLQTDTMSLAHASGELSAPGKVVMTGRGFNVEGWGMRAGEDKGIKLLSNVKATFNN